MPSYSPGKARTSQRTTTATEVRAGATTFMVMAYIIFVNPLILGFGGVPGLQGKGLPFAPTLTVTCLSAGLLSIAMGVFAKYPLALAPGMGLNAVVAFALVARRVRGALLIGIVVTTVVAIVLNGVLAGWKGFATPGAAQLPHALVQAPDFSTFGRIDFGFFTRLGTVTALLAIFSVMLSDFFDTMGTIIAVGEQGGFLGSDGRLPRANRVLLVDSLGAVFGGLANASSATTYIESAAGVAEGARTGLAAVVVGVLFLLSMFFAPLASVIPAQATAPVLILVGLLMMSIAREIAWDDYAEAIPAFVTMLVMPFTWSITNGIGAGFVTYSAIKLLGGRGRQVHFMVYVASAAFLVYFALPLIEAPAK